MSAYLSYLSDAASLMEKDVGRLKAESRTDEANFTRIRCNIYDICRTVHQALSKVHEGDALRAAYLDKLDQLPVNWERSLALAREHGDSEKAAVEELKIRTLAEIRSRYLELE